MPGPTTKPHGKNLFASRMAKTPKSFIREILKMTEKPEVISFAGGLPNPSLFAVEELATAARDVMADAGRAALQYSTTEGYLPLREFIAERYRQRLGLSVGPDEILITNGSQQCLDLIGKVFLDPGDPVFIERPGYLGAIQAFSLYESAFRPVPLLDDGPDIDCLKAMLEETPARLFYGVPNAQNPSGITYSEEKRRAIAAALADTGTIFVEDDAYGELRFGESSVPALKSIDRESRVLYLGSFSQLLFPGMRIGYVLMPEETRKEFLSVLERTSGSTSSLVQHVINAFIEDRSLEVSLDLARNSMASRMRALCKSLDALLPRMPFEIPQGGIYLWLGTPGISGDLAAEAAKRVGVGVVPGRLFSYPEEDIQAVRLSVSRLSTVMIREAIGRVASAWNALT